jgi:lysophospholipase L1-like esterase
MRLAMKEFNLKEIKNVHIYGRTCSDENGVALFWTASGFSVDTTAGELYALIEGDWGNAEPWAGVWVNGVQVSRFIVEKGEKWYCLFRGLPVGKVTHIALLKETQAMSSDEKQMVNIKALGVSDDALNQDMFVAQKSARMKIEFIGDSITTGEGLAGGEKEMDWIPGWMALHDNYAVLTAKKCNADFHILSQSGWGVTGSWDNDRGCSLPKYYDKVCGLVFGGRNEKLGAHAQWNFSSWQPDFVVINLGTNDWGSFNQPAKKDPATGEEWKMHLDSDGKPEAADLKFFTDSVYAFIKKVRGFNVHAHIIWAYGMCSYDLGDDIKRTVERFSRENSDSKIHFVKLAPMSQEKDGEHGSRQHPGPVTHHRAADAICAVIEKLSEVQ